jgi:hypothetical protein
MPSCPHCGLEGLELATGKNGRPYLVQVRRIPHIALCAARKKTGKKPKAGPAPQPEGPGWVDAKLGLVALGYKHGEAKDMLEGVPEGEPDDMIRAALQKEE